MAIDDILFSGAYEETKRRNEAKPMQELQQAAGAMGLMEALQQRAQQQAFQQEIAALGSQPTQEQVTAVASKFAEDPKSLLDIHQKSLDRKETNKQKAIEFGQNLELRQGQLDLAREQFNQRTVDAASRMKFDNWYRVETLKNRQAATALNAQLRTQGFEIQKQGQQLQVMQFDAGKRDREERAIEGQIGKTADRMKDIAPVMTAARQLNDTLNLYTPENVPGVGYWKNTDIGKLFLSGRGKEVSAQIKLFGNSLLKAMSGAAVTPPEELRNMAASMADGRFSAEDFFIAWPKMASWVNDQASLSTAGLTPTARERFLNRTGLKLDPITPRFVFDQQAGRLKDSRAPAAQPGQAEVPLPAGFRLVSP